MHLRAPHRRALVLAGALSAASAATTLTPAGAQGTDPPGTSAPTTTLAPDPTTTPTGPTTTTPTTTTVPSDPAGSTESTVTVSGRGEAVTAPDLGVLIIGVEVRAATVAEAQQQAADRAAAVIEALRQAGIENRDLQTVGIQITPQYRYPDAGAPVAEGYVVRNTLEVTARDVGRIGEVIDSAVAAGGDSTVVTGIRFEASDPGAGLEAAREQAWRDARDRGEQLAALAGGELGRVLSIDEQTGQGGPPVPVERTDAVTPVEPGTVGSTVRLTVRFELLTGPPPGGQEPEPAADASTDPRS